MAALSQAISASYSAILADARKPQSQWADNSLVKVLEEKGFVTKKAGGSKIEAPIDYRKNPGTDFLATDSTAVSTTVTDVIAAAEYDWANLVVPIVYTFADEAKNQGEAQKIALIKSLVMNAINSHDDEVETGLFTTSTDGFLGLSNLVPTTGQPNVGGIDGSSAAYWRNQTDTFDADGSDLRAAMTGVFNACAKGSGSASMPTLVVSGADSHALYESLLQAQQRFERVNTANGGFRALQFKTADYVFSQKGGDNIYFLTPKAFALVVSSGYFRKLSDGSRFTNMAGTQQVVFSQMQAVVANPSRLGVVSPSGS